MIIVSFTTIPKRLEKGLPVICIESLLKQTISPDYIIINIPEFSKNGEKYPTQFMQSFWGYEGVTVQYGVKDQGPITKIVPTLDFIANKLDKLDKLSEDIFIILVDDDCTYKPNMIENLVMAKKKNPCEYVIGTSGRIKQNNKLEFIGVDSSWGNNNHIYVDVIETFSGVLYDYRLFKDTDFLDWLDKLPEFVLLADDIILSSWAKKQNKKLYKIIQNRHPIVSHNPRGTPELSTKNDIGGNNEMVYDYLENLLKTDNLLNMSKNNSFSKFVNNQFMI